MDMFLTASREKYRFQTPKGEISTEQLWDLPLTSKTGMDLDSIAKALNRGVKATEEESFVVTTTNPQKTLAINMLELVKFVINTKIAENAAKVDETKRQEHIRQLEEVLDRKRTEKVNTLSEDEVLAQLTALRAAGK